MDLNITGHYKKVLTYQRNNDFDQIFSAYKHHFEKGDFSRALDILDAMIDIVHDPYTFELIAEHLLAKYIIYNDSKYAATVSTSYFIYLQRFRSIYITNKCINNYFKLYRNYVNILQQRQPTLYKDILTHYIQYGHNVAIMFQLIEICINFGDIDIFLTKSGNTTDPGNINNITILKKGYRLRNIILIRQFIKTDKVLSANQEMTHIIYKFLFG